MKKTKKSTFFIVVAFIALFTVSAVIGLDYLFGDNRKTIIKGGVDVTFAPSGDYDADDTQLDAATEIIKTRLTSLGINDNEVYSDSKSDRIIVRFPWQAGESNFDPEAAVKELGEMAELTFRKGTDADTDEEGNPIPTGEIVLNGNDIASAGYTEQPDDYGDLQWVVTLSLTSDGAKNSLMLLLNSQAQAHQFQYGWITL